MSFYTRADGRPFPRSNLQRTNRPHVDLPEADEGGLEELSVAQVEELRDLFGGPDVEFLGERRLNSTASRSKRRDQKAETGSIAPPWAQIEKIRFGDAWLVSHKTVELRESEEYKKNTFVTISKVIQHQENGKVRLIGHVLHRNESLPMLPQHELGMNEVYLHAEVPVQNGKDTYEQSVIEIALADVARVRRVIFTHEAFPRFSCFEHLLTATRDDARAPRASKSDRKRAREQYELTCRYNMTVRFEYDAVRRKKNVEDVVVRRLFEGEKPTGATKDMILKRCNAPASPDDRYTYGSGFCCAGGDTEGARLAGLKTLAGWDLDRNALKTFELNHPDTCIYQLSADQVISLPDGFLPPCDIWHLSCPCQFFSRPKTRPCHTDDANRAALFAVEAFLAKTRPRVTTGEQTANIVNSHPQYFAALINQYVSQGYNVRWTSTNFLGYGLPSSRPRLVLFAARIGEALPPFPAKTHGPGPGMRRPHVGVGEAIASIRSTVVDWHLPTTVDYRLAPRTATDPAAPARCIVCSDTHVHPSGLRSLSVREMGALNGFPASYRYPPRQEICKTVLLKQIGNAVPPLVWKQFLACVHDTLRAFDQGRIDEAGNRVARPREPAIVGRLPTPPESGRKRRLEISLLDEEEEGEVRRAAREVRRKIQHVTLVDEES